ncbi:MAG: Ig-like domain-containing protein [Candidatus Cloacimonadota bacterium]|nr:Ig-like domain-containing protein [Candidatus Cloacimonadota bacterium]
MKKLISLILFLCLLFIINCSSNNDTTPPTVTISQPQDGATITDSITSIKVNATDNEGIASITLYIDDIEVGSTVGNTTYEYEWFVFYWSDSNDHTIRATACDLNDNKGSKSIDVTVTEEAFIYPELLEPADSSEVQNSIEFKWTSLPDAYQYEVHFAHNDIVFIETPSDTTITKNFDIFGSFKWKVKAERIFIAGADTSKYSPPFHFTLTE